MSSKWPRIVTGVLIALIVPVVVLLGCQAAGPKYPSKPINVIVYTAAGSGLDTFTREAVRLAEPILKVSMPVENRAGGGGNVALTYVMGQPADGYTLAAGTRSLTYSLVAPESPVKVTDFEWVIRGTAEPTSLVVKGDSQFKTLQDLISYSKANPGKVKIGGATSGGFHDAMMNKLGRIAGIKLTWVPYEAANHAAVAAAGGHVDGAQIIPSVALAMIKEGKLRALAVSTDKRLDYLPEVPTYKELGIDMVEGLWRSFQVKKGTPPDIVKTLHDTFKQVFESSEWKEFIKKVPQTDVYMNTEDFNKSVVKEAEEAREYLKEIGLIK